MKSQFKFATAVLLLSALGACSTPPEPIDLRSQSDDRLAESADRATDAARDLADIEAARTAPVEQNDTGNLPPELLRPTTVEWTGPATGLTRELAANIGYTYAIMGQAPAVDVMVNISAKDQPAIKVFEDIGNQVAQFASVYVDPNTKRVEFRFKSNEMVSGSLSPSVDRASGIRRKDRLPK